MTKFSDQMLHYSMPVLLFGNAPLAPSITAMLAAMEDFPVLAADGGVHAALACGLPPQAVIGDMDSATLDQSSPALPDEIRQIRMSGQDDTDFEKCLGLIEAPLIIGFGFMDGRFDHALGVLDVLARLPHGRPVLLIGAHDLLLCLRGNVEIDLPLDSRVSVWPLWQQSFVRSGGLAWPLDGLALRVGKITGTSNKVSSRPVVIEAGAGDGYAVITSPDSFDAIYRTAMALASKDGIF